MSTIRCHDHLVATCFKGIRSDGRRLRQLRRSVVTNNIIVALGNVLMPHLPVDYIKVGGLCTCNDKERALVYHLELRRVWQKEATPASTCSVSHDAGA